MAKKRMRARQAGRIADAWKRRTRAAIAEPESRGAWLIGEQDRCVPSPTSGLRDVFQAARDIGQQMVMVVEIVSRTDSEGGRRQSTTSIRGLMKDFDTRLKVLQDLTGDGGAVEAEIPGCVVKRKLAAAATEGRGRTQSFLIQMGRSIELCGSPVCDGLGRKTRGNTLTSNPNVSW